MSDSSASPKRCQQCGAEMPDAAGGICPRCLMAQIIQPTEAGDQSHLMPLLAAGELAPHFPQLEILECLGRGGMGVVYKARQKSLNRFVALKLLAPERVADAKFAQRFTHEAQALAALNHPNIVTIYDFGQAGGFYFLLMEFVDGVNLRQAMKAGRFTPEQALAIVPPVCEALQYAHEHGIVHRDIKPENLLLDREGRVKIADFGIAKILEPGGADLPLGPDIGAAQQRSPTGSETLASAAGTPQYMAPEQKAHRVTDHRADIYSLGVVLYELLTGELPADKLQPPSRKVQIDVRLDEIVLRALEAKPERRYQTAGEFRTQVETVVSTPGNNQREQTPVGNPNPEPQREARNPNSKRGAFVGLTIFVLTMAAFIAMSYLLAQTWVSQAKILHREKFKSPEDSKLGARVDVSPEDVTSLLTSEALLTEVITELDLKNKWIVRNHWTGLSDADIRQRLRALVSVQQIPRTAVYTLSCASTVLEEAQLIMSKLLWAYCSMRRDALILQNASTAFPGSNSYRPRVITLGALLGAVLGTCGAFATSTLSQRRSRQRTAGKFGTEILAASSKPLPWTLCAVAVVFFAYGGWATWQMVEEILRSNVSLNLALLGIPIGIGLLARRRLWRNFAAAFLVFGLICFVILISSQLTHPDEQKFWLFGVPLVAWSLTIWANCLLMALHGWMLWVLARPTVAILFALDAAPLPAKQALAK